MLELDYYTVGGGEYIDFALKALEMLLGDNAFSTLIRVTFLWGMIWAITLSVFGWQYRTLFIRHMATTFFALHLFFMPVVNLNIVDTKTGQTFVQDGVPFVPGFAMSFFSHLGRYLTKFFEAVGHTGVIITWGASGGAVPVQLDYSKTGFAGMFDFYNALLSIDPTMAARKFEAFDMMQAYILKCFVPYTSTMSQTDIRQLLRSNDLLAEIRVDTSTLMEYRGNVYTCTDFYNNQLVPAWQDMVSGLSADPLLAGIQPYNVPNITAAINALTNASHNFSTVVSQAGIINSFKYVMSTYTFGDQSVDLLAQYAKARTEEQSKAIGRAFGVWVKENLPLLKNFLEAFIILLLPLTGLVMLMPFPGARLILGYLHFLAWVYLWDPVLAILDIFIKMSAIAKAQAWLASQGASGLSLVTYGYIMDQAQWFPAIAGYIGLTAPMWAWAILKGFEVSVYGINYMIGNMGANMLNQEMSPQRLGYLTQQERLAREAGFMNAGEAGWFASGYAATGETAQGLVNSSMRGPDLLKASVGALSHGLGRGLAAFNAHRGSFYDMLNSAALGAPSANYMNPQGLMERQYTDISGRPVKVAISPSVETPLWSLDNVEQILSQERRSYQEKLSEAENKLNSVVSSLVSSHGAGLAFSKVFGTVEDYKEAYSKTHSSAIKTMSEHVENLSRELSDTFGLTKDESERLATQLMFKLSADGKNPEAVRGFLTKALATAGIDAQTTGQLVDKFTKSKAFREAKTFAQGDNFRQALEDISQYTVNMLGDEQWSRSHNLNESERAELLNQLNSAIRWARNYEHAKEALDSLEEARSYLRSMHADFGQKFVNWYANIQGTDPVTAGKELTNLYMKDPSQFRSLVFQFFDETKDSFSTDVQGRLERGRNAVVKVAGDMSAEVSKVVEHGRNIVETHYANNQAIVEGKYGNLRGEVETHLNRGGALKKEVTDAQVNIQKAITAQAEHVRTQGSAVGPAGELTEGQRKLEDAKNNPLNMLGHMWNQGPGSRVLMGAAGLMALEGHVVNTARLGKMGIDAIRGLGGSIGSGGPVPYGRWNWISGFVEGYGAILRMPVMSAGGMAGALALAPLVGLGAYTGTRLVMENVTIGGKNLDDHLYEKVTEPVLDWIGEKTGWWTPVGR